MLSPKDLPDKSKSHTASMVGILSSLDLHRQVVISQEVLPVSLSISRGMGRELGRYVSLHCRQNDRHICGLFVGLCFLSKEALTKSQKHRGLTKGPANTIYTGRTGQRCSCGFYCCTQLTTKTLHTLLERGSVALVPSTVLPR